MLAEAVESILQGEEVPTELIIVDQSDVLHLSLATLSTNRPCELRYIWTQFVGLSRANNYGIVTSQHDLLIFTHDDILVTPTWFGVLVRSLISSGLRAVVTGRVLPTTAEASGNFAPSTKADEVSEIYEGRISTDVLYPMNMAIHRSAFDEIGKFDEHLGPGTPFPGAEDNDFGFRLLEAGYRIIYVPQAILYHRAWRSERDYIPLHWSYGRGQGAYYAKHLSLRDRYMLWRMVMDVKNHISQFAGLARRQRRLAYAHAVYVLGLLSGTVQWLLMQHRTR
jgi:GT2 family glycosyltransferase